MRLDDRDELGPRARAAREPDPAVDFRDAPRSSIRVDASFIRISALLTTPYVAPVRPQNK